MKKVWQTIKGYLWWTHPRGSFHYDVMVTLILLFIFVAPHFINFKDKFAERLARPRSVVVLPNGDRGFIFRVDARDIPSGTPDEMQLALLRVIEPIAGDVRVERWAPDLDSKGAIVGYHVWVHR
jgi:hypothetical protein